MCFELYIPNKNPNSCIENWMLLKIPLRKMLMWFPLQKSDRTFIVYERKWQKELIHLFFLATAYVLSSVGDTEKRTFCLFQFSIKLICNAKHSTALMKKKRHIIFCRGSIWTNTQTHGYWRAEPNMKFHRKDVKYVSLWKLAAITHTMQFQFNQKWKSKHRLYVCIHALGCLCLCLDVCWMSSMGFFS